MERVLELEAELKRTRRSMWFARLMWTVAVFSQLFLVHYYKTQTQGFLSGSQQRLRDYQQLHDRVNNLQALEDEMMKHCGWRNVSYK